MATDQSWLWDRGYEGGGPQLELLRRLAHWLMKEPELEEEALWVEPAGQTMRIIRRTLGEEVPEVTITHPDGTESVVTLEPVSPGRFELQWEAPEIGLYKLTDGEESTVIALGPAAPRVKGGIDLVGDDYDAGGEGAALTPVPDANPLDCNGHGSHVAGTTAGLGVASDGSTWSGGYTKDIDPGALEIGPGVAALLPSKRTVLRANETSRPFR